MILDLKSINALPAAFAHSEYEIEGVNEILSAIKTTTQDTHNDTKHKRHNTGSSINAPANDINSSSQASGSGGGFWSVFSSVLFSDANSQNNRDGDNYSKRLNVLKQHVCDCKVDVLFQPPHNTTGKSQQSQTRKHSNRIPNSQESQLDANDMIHKEQRGIIANHGYKGNADSAVENKDTSNTLLCNRVGCNYVDYDDASMISFLKTLILSRDVRSRPTMEIGQNLEIESAFCVDMITTLVVNNKNRLHILWPITLTYFSRILSAYTAGELSNMHYLVERVMAGLVRISFVLSKLPNFHNGVISIINLISSLKHINTTDNTIAVRRACAVAAMVKHSGPYIASSKAIWEAVFKYMRADSHNPIARKIIWHCLFEMSDLSCVKLTSLQDYIRTLQVFGSKDLSTEGDCIVVCRVLWNINTRLLDSILDEDEDSTVTIGAHHVSSFDR